MTHQPRPGSEQIALQLVIRQREGCSASWRETIPITERMGSEVVWHGEGQVFELDGHATAKRAYAWLYEDDDGRQQAKVVLHVPPVDSARKAVQAAIAAEYRGKA